MSVKKNIILLGAGNVATQLGITLKTAGHTILQIYSPTKRSAQALSKLLNTTTINDLKKINTAADIYIIAIKDDVVKNITKKLKLKNKIVAHTSGSTTINVLKCTSKNYGVF